MDVGGARLVVMGRAKVEVGGAKAVVMGGARVKVGGASLTLCAPLRGFRSLRS